MSISLSPSLKHLIALKPLRSKGLPPSVSQTLFTTFQSEARAKNLKDSAWIVPTTATLCTANSPVSLSQLSKFVQSSQVSKKKEEKVYNAELMREAGIKCIGFIGIAKVIISLESIASSLDPEIKQLLRQTARREVTAENLGPMMNKGSKLWRQIYTPHDAKLIEKLKGHHPDLPVSIMYEYSYLFSDPDIPAGIPDVERPVNVGRILTSLVGIGCLRGTSEPVTPQVTSHVLGLLKCQNLTPEESDSDQVGEGYRWLIGNEGAEWVVTVVDRVYEEVEKSERSEAEVQAKL